MYLYLLPRTSGKEPACQCRRHKRHGFDPWVGKILWRRAWQPTSVFFLACTVLSHLSRVWLFVTPWTVGSLPGSSVHGILQAKILEWVAMPSSRRSSQPEDWTHVSAVSYIGWWVLFFQFCLFSSFRKLTVFIKTQHCTIRKYEICWWR